MDRWRGPLHDHDAIAPLIKGVSHLQTPHCEPVAPRLSLVVGDLSLARLEEELSAQWSLCLDGRERAFRVTTALWQCIQQAAAEAEAEVALVDLGPNLGAINRAVLVATNYVVVPATPDLLSLQGLRNLGPTLREWRAQWQERVPRNPDKTLALPAGEMRPIGYVVLQYPVRLDRGFQAHDRWMLRVPEVYAQDLLEVEPSARHPSKDDQCLSIRAHGFEWVDAQGRGAAASWPGSGQAT